MTPPPGNLPGFSRLTQWAQRLQHKQQDLTPWGPRGHGVVRCTQPNRSQLKFLAQWMKTEGQHLNSVLLQCGKVPEDALLAEIDFPIPTRIEPLSPQGVRPSETFLKSRGQGDAVVEALKGWDEDFFKWPEMHVDWENYYRFYLQFHLAQHEGYLYDPVGEPVCVLDGMIPQGVGTHQGGAFYSLYTARLAQVEALFMGLNDGDGPGSQEIPFPMPLGQGAPVWVVVNMARMGDKLQPSTTPFLRAGYPVVLLMATRAEADALMDSGWLPPWIEKGQLVVWALDEVSLSGEAIGAIQGYGRKRLAHVATMGESAQGPLLHHLKRLFGPLKESAAFHHLLSLAPPRAIIGFLDQSRFGYYALAFQQAFGYRVITLQHGNIPQAHYFDRVRFDRFWLWNEYSKDLLATEGYPAMADCVVVGNPAWEQLALAVAEARRSKPIDMVPWEEWKGEDILLVAFGQVHTAFTPVDARTQFYRLLLEALADVPGVKLLIKKHPLEKDTLAESCVAEAMAQEPSLKSRVRITPGQGEGAVSMMIALQLGDGFTSMYSTALLDALVTEKPVFAIDLNRVSELLGLGLASAMPVATDEGLAKQLLAQVLRCQLESALWDMGADRQRFVPSFQEDSQGSDPLAGGGHYYSQRILRDCQRMGVVE